ncbi:MAG: hypothetical protein H0V92_04070 [Pseudonocardiales bacterium]|nr:hypothetical protein [Pseudonocardiales bacterium]
MATLAAYPPHPDRHRDRVQPRRCLVTGRADPTATEGPALLPLALADATPREIVRDMVGNFTTSDAGRDDEPAGPVHEHFACDSAAACWAKSPDIHASSAHTARHRVQLAGLGRVLATLQQLRHLVAHPQGAADQRQRVSCS